MTSRIFVIQGHPDPAGGRLCHALAEAYADGAENAGHEVRRIDVAALDFPLLRTKSGFENDDAPPSLRPAQEAIARADHLVIVYPLWLGTMPALLKGFFEQVLRPGFAFGQPAAGTMGKAMLRGRSARIVITMGMPALIYRWYFRAHSLKSLERNILRFCGIGPIRESLFGMVEAVGGATRRRWLEEMRRLGGAAR
ncbi:MAG: NAD(P)H-dependent oxidoreductase [Inquilinus sp.]|nr:NAD(P)H-dependent oxidoreductase [Inquilinus sp.]